MSAINRMALLITDECINCDVCEPGARNDAIVLAPKSGEIDLAKCTGMHWDTLTRRSVARCVRSIASP